MRTSRFGSNLLMEASDFSNGYSNDYLKGHMFALTKCFTRRTLFRQLVSAYHDFSDLEGVALLKAHGNTDTKWRFSDGERWHYMQNLIDNLDGSFSTIFLYSCNPGNKGRIYSNNSVVIHPNRTFKLAGDFTRKSFFRLYFPGEGYIEDNPRKMKNLINEMNHTYSF